MCPSGGDCGALPTDPGGYEGIVVVHEQTDWGGNPGLDGFIIVEDAASCDDDVSSDATLHGTPKVHYDCDNPPNPWAATHVRVLSWEEVQ